MFDRELISLISKKDIILFLILVVIFTSISTRISLYMIKTQYQKLDYHFSPNIKISQFVFHDRIDSDEKLLLVLQNSTISKEMTPQIGDFVSLENKKLTVNSYKDIQNNFHIYPLANNHENTLEQTYVFNTNTITIAKKQLFVEQINSKDILTKKLKNKEIYLVNKENLKIGSYIWKTPNGYYTVLENQNFSQEYISYDNTY